MWRSPMKYRPYDQKAFILMKKTQNSQKMVVRNRKQTRKRYKTRGMRAQKKEARATYFGSFLWIWPPIRRKQLKIQDGVQH